MIKVLVFIQKLPSVSMTQFRDHYEKRHAPMINELLPMYAGYKRNYLGECMWPDNGIRRWDAVTELFFESAERYEAWKKALGDPAVIARIREDEAHFLLSSATEMWMVEECSDDLPVNKLSKRPQNDS